MISRERAIAAKITLRTQLGLGDPSLTRVNAPWFRGMGIGMDKAGSHFIKVNVATKSDTKHVPSEIVGVPILTAVSDEHFPLD